MKIFNKPTHWSIKYIIISYIVNWPSLHNIKYLYFKIQLKPLFLNFKLWLKEFKVLI
jgi:hypothetical protein